MLKKLWASIASVAVLVLGFGLVSSGPAQSSGYGFTTYVAGSGVVVVQPNSTENVTVECPSGKPVSGGWNFTQYYGSQDLRVTKSWLPNASAVSWETSFYNPTNNALVAVATVNCITVP